MRLNDTQQLEVQLVGPLTFVYYEEEGFEGIVGAHCLELDIGGQGASREDATRSLQEAIETFVLFHVNEGQPWSVEPAPPSLANLPDRRTYHLLLVRTLDREEPVRTVRFVEPPERFTPEAAFA